MQTADTRQTRVVVTQLYSHVVRVPAKAQRQAQATVPREWSLAPGLDRGGGSLVHCCLPPSPGSSPRNRLLSEGRVAEPEPWQGAARGGPPSLLLTGSSQLHLRVPVPAVEDPGSQASLSHDLPRRPWLPKFLGCLGPLLGLQRRGDCTPKLPGHSVSLAEGRGERFFLRLLHLEAWRERLSSGPLPWRVPSIGLDPQGLTSPTYPPPL